MVFANGSTCHHEQIIAWMKFRFPPCSPSARLFAVVLFDYMLTGISRWFFARDCSNNIHLALMTLLQTMWHTNPHCVMRSNLWALQSVLHVILVRYEYLTIFALPSLPTINQCHWYLIISKKISQRKNSAPAKHPQKQLVPIYLQSIWG